MDKVTAAYLFLNVWQIYENYGLTAEELGYEGESEFVRAAILKCEAVSQRLSQLVDFSKYDGVFYYEEADRNDDTSLASVIYKSLKGEEDGVDEWIKSTLKSCLHVARFRKSTDPHMNYSWVDGLLSFTLWLSMVFGWVINVIVAIQGDFSALTGVLVLHVVGIFVPPLGAVMGWVWLLTQGVEYGPG